MRSAIGNRLPLVDLAEWYPCRVQCHIRCYVVNKWTRNLPAKVDGQGTGQAVTDPVARNESLARPGLRARIEKTYGLVRSHGVKRTRSELAACCWR